MQPNDNDNNNPCHLVLPLCTHMLIDMTDFCVTVALRPAWPAILRSVLTATINQCQNRLSPAIINITCRRNSGTASLMMVTSAQLAFYLIAGCCKLFFVIKPIELYYLHNIGAACCYWWSVCVFVCLSICWSWPCIQ